MRIPRFQFRVDTIMIVTALAALALGAAKAAERSKPRGQTAGGRIVAEVLEAREAREAKKADSTSTNDLVLIAAIPIVFALALAWRKAKYSQRNEKLKRPAWIPRDRPEVEGRGR